MHSLQRYGYDYWHDAAAGNEIGTIEAVREMIEDLPLTDILKLADQLAREQVGDLVTFTASYNINYTNYCAASCPICAFYVPLRAKKHANGGYVLTPEQVRREAEKAKALGATEIHIVGGFNGDLSIEYYEEIFRTVKKTIPEAILKALTIPEYDYIARTTGNSLREVALRFKDAGVEAHTGGGAEIFDPDVRRQITTPEKIDGERWLEDAELLHSLGLKGNSTITYGHIEKLDHIIDHLLRLRKSQMKIPGFLSLIPLKFSPYGTALQRMGRVTQPAPAALDLLVTALARIIDGPAIRNISVYWVAIGKRIAQIAIDSGGNDLVGTAFSEKVFLSTSRNEVSTAEELSELIRQTGKIPALRDTFYRILRYT